MTKPTHTPGPWRLLRPANQHHDAAIATPHGNYILKWDSTASVPYAQRTADAEIICNAPALSGRDPAALEDVIRAAKRCCVRVGDSEWYEGIAGDSEVELRAALTAFETDR